MSREASSGHGFSQNFGLGLGLGDTPSAPSLVPGLTPPSALTQGPGCWKVQWNNNSHWFALEMLRHVIKWFFQKQHDEDEKGRIQLASASVNALACYHVPSTWITRFLKESVLLRRLLLNQFHMEGSEIWKKEKWCGHAEHPWGFTSYTPFNGFQTTPAPGAVSMAAPTPAYSTTLCTTQEAAPAPRAFAEMEESK